MQKKLLLMGGLINLVFGLLHLGLGKALNWSETLSCLSLDNRATVYTLNLHLAFICFAFAYLSFFHREMMFTTKIGKAMTAVIGLFWILRIANQIVFYGLSAIDTPLWVVVCLLVSLFYFIPLVGKRSAASAPLPS